MIKRLADEIKRHKKILIACHVSPDGDTIGSCIAIAHAASKLGIQARVACADEIPDVYKEIDGSGMVETVEAITGWRHDASFAVDVPSRERLGRLEEEFYAADVTMLIDHHPTNPGFADINHIDADAAATGILIYELICHIGVEMDHLIRQWLYIAIITDTGNFSYENTDARSLACAAKLVGDGVDIAGLTRKIYRTRSEAQLKILGAAIKSLKRYDGGGISVMRLLHEDFAHSCARHEDAEGIVNYAIELSGTKIAALAQQTPDGMRVSIRSIAPYDSAAAAGMLAGGGHDRAAGGLVKAQPGEAMDIILSALRRSIELIEGK